MKLKYTASAPGAPKRIKILGNVYNVGDEIEVSKEVGESLLRKGFEVVKKRRKPRRSDS